LLRNPQWSSLPENKQFARQTLERSRELFYKYEPYYNRRDNKPSWQWKFLAAANDYKGRLALGANRIGKSDQGAYECVLAATGKHPCREFPAQSSGWIVGLDYNMVRDINLPKFDKFLPRNFAIESTFNKADKIWWLRGEGRECKIKFMSSDAGRAKFQGDSVDWIWFDEEPLKTDIWPEAMRALIDKEGIWWMTATPVLGTAWLKALSEKENVFVTTGTMWDNPYLPMSEIEAQAAEWSEEERLVRVEGEYIIFGGSPVFNIRLLTKMINGLDNDVPISEGFLASHAA
jgi:phage terminase large subunit-like protein